MILANKSALAFVLSVALAASALVAGCGQEEQAQQKQAAQVKVMQAIQQDTPLTSSYAGSLAGKDEVKVQARVSGNIVEKYVQGGQFVTVGQPLYRIDSRQYESAVLQAQATLAQSEATLSNARVDLYRDQELLKADAISEQTVTTQQANVNAYEAAAAANAALLKKAQEDLDDTVVYAPMTGQLSVDDVAVGTYAVAGSTTLVTMGSSNPIYAQFSISETDYLKFMNVHRMHQNDATYPEVGVELSLSDGSKYPMSGVISESDRGMADSTGTLTLKALFDNPEGILLPGMFARVTLTGQTVPNAILVPQRAVQQLLGKSFVMVVNGDSKSEARTVELGDKVGSYYIIKSGINADDLVVVEGLTNLQEGRDLAVTMVSAEEMGFSLEENNKQFDPDASTVKKQ